MSFRNYYDSTSYGRSRELGRGAAGMSERPTSVTAKYSNITPTYKSSSIPVLAKDEAPSPISAIANRYANYSKTDKTPKKDFDKPTTASKYDKKDYLDKPTSKYEKKEYDKPISKFEKKDYIDKPTSKYEKKDYSKLTIPSLSTSRSRDVSPISTSSKYSLNRPSRHLSPERRTNKNYKDKSRDPSPADREKDIPSKTDKSTGYNSLLSYKLYPRSSSYTRPASRTETKPDINVSRYSISNRLSSNYLRSPPTVSRTSVSPVNHTDSVKDSKSTEKSVSPVVPPSSTTINEGNERSNEGQSEVIENGTETIVEEVGENETETVIVITRHTSPTPPGSSAYVRSRRADMAKTIEKTFTRTKVRPQMVDREVQSDRLDDPTRTSRFGSTARASTTNWSYYGPNSTNYTGYAGRHLTQYAALRENSSQSYSDRSSRSQSNERLSKDSTSSHSHSENTKEVEKSTTPLNDIPESNQEIIATYEQTKDDDTSEIIINVNLKLKKTNSPMVTAVAELVSPEITITNSQLPPQAPKPEGAVKTKKLKIRKSSTDSSDSGSKKKIVKRKSKSGSSTDSDPGSDANERIKDSNSTPKSNMANSSNSSLQNGPGKIKHSKSRESNSPESVSTLSTQSSVSEDDTVSKSKTNDARTSADELSIPTDRSPKQSSPVVSQKADNTEEAKSFLIRALAPVTNLFKMRSQDSTESKTLPESSTSESTGKDVSNLITESERSSKSKTNTSNIIASNDDNVVKLKAIRHIESGERAWWLDSPSEKPNTEQSSDIRSPSEKNIPKKIRHIESGERAWWLESNSESKHDNHQTSQTQTYTSESTDPNKPFKKYKYVEEEKPWWLDSAANIPEGVERLSPPRKSSSESEKSEKFTFIKVRRIESGDQKDWWVTSNENSSNSKSEGQNSHSQTESEQKSFPLRRIRHVESGERPWWLSSNKNIPEGIEKLPTPPPQADSDSSDSEEVQAYVTPAQIPPFPLHLPDDEPLGTRRSPEGLETPKENEDYGGRTSPYENNRQYMRNIFQNGPEKYVSRYTDMEDFMGDTQRYSPFMARRTGVTGSSYDDDECKEIDPTQVRIHDSTAQMPVIMKVRGRGEVVDYRDEDQLDDGSLQGYKDGDYGAYLDLESAQGEQADREGLQHRLNDDSLMKRNLSINSKKPNDLAKSSNLDAEIRVGSPRLPPITDNKENKELSTALRRRRDRHARQAHHITQQQELLNNSHSIFNGLFGSAKANHNGTNGTNGYTNQLNGQDEEPYRTTKPINLGNVLKNGNQRYTAGLKQRIQNGNLGDSVNALDALTVIRQKQIDSPEVKEDRGIIINREHSIKDLAQRLTSPVSPTTEDKPIRVSDMSGIVSKAKEELAKSQSKEVIKSPTREIAPKVHEIKISENDLHWEELRKGCLNREFHLCDLDFSDLRLDSDEDADSPSSNALGIPPPPPPGLICFPPPPTTFPTSRNSVPAPPPKPPLSSEYSQDSDSSNFKKNKKTVKLFWREIHESPAPISFRSKQEGLIWDDLPEVCIDTSMLEQLFESKSNDLILKKLMEPKRNLILDTKRSNAINIAMKKLPTPQTIKTAILKMDATVIGREGIEKLMTMLPTEEETIKIQEAQCANPDLPLGSAEQFLLTLASISELPRRLKLWVFKLDFDNLEKEIAEPLMDLKQGIEQLKVNKTFKVILSTLRSVGSFLNGSQVKGFRLEYLAKVMEVKDTVHKHPLLYHVCEMIIDKFPDTTDFFSEVGPVIRASKVDFDALTSTLQKLETDCKASWDHLKRVAEDDSSSVFATKFNEFLTDAAERIILLSLIFKRVMSRFSKFLLYMGVPPGDVNKTKPSEFLKVIAEFALEYRTTRERVLLQLEKKANHRERNKAKKMVIDVSPYSSRNGDHSAADSALKQLLNTDADAEGRRKSMHAITNGDFSADDEIIESLVRSAASKRRPAQSRKNRISHKKNLTRCRDGKDS